VYASGCSRITCFAWIVCSVFVRYFNCYNKSDSRSHKGSHCRCDKICNAIDDTVLAMFTNIWDLSLIPAKGREYGGNRIECHDNSICLSSNFKLPISVLASQPYDAVNVGIIRMAFMLCILANTLQIYSRTIFNLFVINMHKLNKININHIINMFS